MMLHSLKLLYAAPLFAGALAVSGCGSTMGERALSGGAIGAVGGAVVGGGEGAVIGGVGGAAVGALTCIDRDRHGRCLRWRRR
jgi:hypothetical protein